MSDRPAPPLSREDPSISLRTGRVVFVGAGPGTADLITVRGARALATADVVLFDALTDDSLRDTAPAARWINVGKRGYDHGTAQDHINALMVAHACRGLTVVRLKGGDPSVFGRLEEELEVLQAEGIACEVVPGVTAALAAAAQTLRPLTRRGRGRSVSLTTAVTHDDAYAVVPDDDAAAAGPRDDADAVAHNSTGARSGRVVSDTRSGRVVSDTRSGRVVSDTEVFYMASRQLGNLPRTLQAAGWQGSTPVCIVSQAGTPDMLSSQHTVATMAEATLLHAGRPTVVTVGVGATAVGVASNVAASTTNSHAPTTRGARATTALEPKPADLTA